MFAVTKMFKESGEFTVFAYNSYCATVILSRKANQISLSYVTNSDLSAPVVFF